MQQSKVFLQYKLYLLNMKSYFCCMQTTNFKNAGKPVHEHSLTSTLVICWPESINGYTSILSKILASSLAKQTGLSLPNRFLVI